MKLPTHIKTDPGATLAFRDGPLFVEFFLSKLIHFLPIILSLTEFFLQWDIKNLSFIKGWDQVCDIKTMGSNPNLNNLDSFITCPIAQLVIQPMNKRDRIYLYPYLSDPRVVFFF